MSPQGIIHPPLPFAISLSLHSFSLILSVYLYKYVYKYRYLFNICLFLSLAHAAETLSTLRFGQKAKKIKNKVKVSAISIFTLYVKTNNYNNTYTCIYISLILELTSCFIKVDCLLFIPNFLSSLLLSTFRNIPNIPLISLLFLLLLPRDR